MPMLRNMRTHGTGLKNAQIYSEKIKNNYIIYAYNMYTWQYALYSVLYT